MATQKAVDLKGADNLDEVKFTMVEFCCGTLARKIDLDEDGQRHSNRSWQSFYTLVKGPNLLFYKNKEKYEKLEAPSMAIDLESSLIAMAKEYKGKRDIIIVRALKGLQILLDSGNNDENHSWFNELKLCKEHIFRWKAGKLIKERDASERYLNKICKEYGLYSGAPLTQEALLAIRTVEQEIAALDDMILAMKARDPSLGQANTSLAPSSQFVSPESDHQTTQGGIMNQSQTFSISPSPSFQGGDLSRLSVANRSQTFGSSPSSFPLSPSPSFTNNMGGYHSFAIQNPLSPISPSQSFLFNIPAPFQSVLSPQQQQQLQLEQQSMQLEQQIQQQMRQLQQLQNMTASQTMSRSMSQMMSSSSNNMLTSSSSNNLNNQLQQKRPLSYTPMTTYGDAGSYTTPVHNSILGSVANAFNSAAFQPFSASVPQVDVSTNATTSLLPVAPVIAPAKPAPTILHSPKSIINDNGNGLNQSLPILLVQPIHDITESNSAHTQSIDRIVSPLASVPRNTKSPLVKQVSDSQGSAPNLNSSAGSDISGAPEPPSPLPEVTSRRPSEREPPRSMDSTKSSPPTLQNNTLVPTKESSNLEKSLPKENETVSNAIHSQSSKGPESQEISTTKSENLEQPTTGNGTGQTFSLKTKVEDNDVVETSKSLAETHSGKDTELQGDLIAEVKPAPILNGESKVDQNASFAGNKTDTSKAEITGAAKAILARNVKGSKKPKKGRSEISSTEETVPDEPTDKKSNLIDARHSNSTTPSSSSKKSAYTTISSTISTVQAINNLATGKGKHKNAQQEKSEKGQEISAIAEEAKEEWWKYHWQMDQVE